MSDLPSAPKRPSPQQGKPRPVAKPAARKPGSMTDQQKLIGYGVLGFGVLAMLGVGWVAVSRMPEKALTAPAAQEQKATVETKTPPVVQAQQDKVGRISGVSEKQITGTWSSQFADIQTIFQIGDGTYQILAARSAGSPSHYYSRGTYTLKDDLLTLTPDGKMGAPESDNVKYTRLTGRPFSVIAGMANGHQIWRPGPPDPQFPNRTTLHPLIRMSGGEMVVWQKTKD